MLDVSVQLYYSDRLFSMEVVIGIGQVAGHAISTMEIVRVMSTDFNIQQMTAVTAACLALRREIFNEVGGLNEQDPIIAFNDVDFCMRVHARGYRKYFHPVC